MKTPSFYNSGFRFKFLSQLFLGKFQKNNNQSSSAEKLKDEITSSNFEKRLKILAKNDLEKFYTPIIIEKVLKDISFLVINNEKTETPVTEPSLPSREPEITKIVENEKMDEVLKVHSRVPGWFQKPHQINSRILIAYLELLEEGKSIPLYKLESSCSSIKTFKNNYTQMKSFGERNHAKVFEESGGRVTLWEPVRMFVKEEYEKYNKRRGKNK